VTRYRQFCADFLKHRASYSFIYSSVEYICNSPQAAQFLNPICPWLHFIYFEMLISAS